MSKKYPISYGTLADLTYRTTSGKSPEDFGDSWGGWTSDDYETGWTVRIAAIQRIGASGDRRLVPELRRGLYDCGDKDGGDISGCVHYYRHSKDIQKAAVQALVELGGPESIALLEEKLKRCGEPKFN